MDAITLAIIKQFPRPCLSCGCYLEQPLRTPKEYKDKTTCQMCGDYLCESCQTRAGAEFDMTYQDSEFNQAEKDLYNDGPRGITSKIISLYNQYHIYFY